MTKRKKGRGAVPRIVANKGRRLQVAAPSRRKPFDAERKERFPDRADAMVWALTELMHGKARAEPRILTL